MKKIFLFFILATLITCKPKGDPTPEDATTVYPNYVLVSGNSGQTISLNWAIGKSQGCGFECMNVPNYKYYQPDRYDVYLSTENEKTLRKVATVTGNLNKLDLDLPDKQLYYFQVRVIYNKARLDIASNVILLTGDAIPKSDKIEFQRQSYSIDWQGSQYTANIDATTLLQNQSKTVLTGGDRAGGQANWIQDFKTGEQVFIWKTTRPVSGKISPDGSKALLTTSDLNSDGTYTNNLYLFEVAQRRITPLTTWKKEISNVIWNPSSEFCSLVYFDRASGEVALATINISTAKLNILRQENLNRFNSIAILDWLSYDGQVYFKETIDFPSSTARMTIYSISVNGDKLSKVTAFENTTSWYEYSQTISPNGDKIIFTSRKSGKIGMWLKDVKQNRIFQVVNSLPSYHSIVGWRNNTDFVYQVNDNSGKEQHFSLSLK